MNFFEVFLRGSRGAFLGHFIDKKLDGWEVGGTSVFEFRVVSWGLGD